MATDKQIAANRLNAQKCCGPKTPAGRAISSQNALKTGLDAKSEIIEGCESRVDRDRLTARYYARYAPVTEEESYLVDTAIAFEWLQRRYLAVEANMWMRKLDDNNAQSLGTVFDRASASFTRVGGRLNAAFRNHSNAMKQLHALRAKRGADPLGNIPDPEIEVAPEPLNPEPAPPLPIPPIPPANPLTSDPIGDPVEPLVEAPFDVPTALLIPELVSLLNFSFTPAKPPIPIPPEDEKLLPIAA